MPYHRLHFSEAKDLGEIPTASHPLGAQNTGRKVKYVTLEQNLAISQKPCKTGTQLLWQANKNSSMLYRMALFPVTLSDPNYPKALHFPPIFIMAAWHGGNSVGRINEATLCRARLVLGWMTCPGSTPGGGTLFRYVTSHAGRLSLSSFRGQ